ncbi:hypothetical protein EX895_003127 [Sporisorium graminicola]|uniref:Uncharacterized protein n=1 Tax=Sporisorium graminicola TaxID=280036 RepID=A0A4U7KU09_9BASI|nr:hypothetical protein EX895_003127 [Sporisorium graminicola]TKY88031.1 hypothetical protein EX895_003127 [Sporisorium graminicola]
MIAATRAAGLAAFSPLADPSKPCTPAVCTDIGASCTSSSIRPYTAAPEHTPRKPTRTPASAPAPGLLTRIVLAVCDWTWRQWYNFIATWGISVMEPWERVFALSLMAACVALLGVACVKLPACIAYALSRAGFYVFGPPSNASPSTAGPAAAAAARGMSLVNNGSSATGIMGAGGVVDLHMCQQALASGLLTLVQDSNASIDAVGATRKVVVGGGGRAASWPLSS